MLQPKTTPGLKQASSAAKPLPQDPEDLIELRKLLRAADDPRKTHQDESKAREVLLTYLSKNLQKGTWQAFKEFVQSLRVNRFGFDPAMTVKAKTSTQLAHKLSTDTLGMLPCIERFFETNHCPALTMVLITQQMTTVARRDLAKYKANEQVLLHLSTPGAHAPSLNPSWFAIFQELGLAAGELRSVMTTEISASGISPATSVVMAADAVALITTFVLLAIHSVHAESNLAIIKAFFEMSFVDPRQRKTNMKTLNSIYALFNSFCNSNNHRCTSKGPCTEHILDVWKDSASMVGNDAAQGVSPSSLAVPVAAELEISSPMPRPLKDAVTKPIVAKKEGATYDPKSSQRTSPSSVSYSVIRVRNKAAGAAVSGISQEQKVQENPAHDDEDDGFDVARKALQVAEAQLRAYHAAQLNPPEMITQAIHDLTLALHGVRVMTRTMTRMSIATTTKATARAKHAKRKNDLRPSRGSSNNFMITFQITTAQRRADG